MSFFIKKITISLHHVKEKTMHGLFILIQKKKKKRNTSMFQQFWKFGEITLHVDSH